MLFNQKGKKISYISILYLDNMNDVFNLCEKSYIYFIEFINQLSIKATTTERLGNIGANKAMAVESIVTIGKL